MNKQEALKLLAAMAKASTRHYAVVNGLVNKNSSATKAAEQELNAAKNVFAGLCADKATNEELEQALGW